MPEANNNCPVTSQDTKKVSMVPVTLQDTALAKLLTDESFNSKTLSNLCG